MVNGGPGFKGFKFLKRVSAADGILTTQLPAKAQKKQKMGRRTVGL